MLDTDLRPTIRLIRGSLRTALQRAVPIVLLMCSAGFGTMVAQDLPYSLTETERVQVEGLIAEIEALPTIRERHDRYVRELGQTSARGKVAVAASLIGALFKNAGKFPESNYVQQLYAEVPSHIDTTGLTAEDRNHIRCQIARNLAFAGYITEGEQQLLELLALPTEEVHALTRGDAHYALGYCGYYTDNLTHAATQVAQAAQLYLGLGLEIKALECYDGASTTYFKMGQVDSALHYARRGLAVQREINSDGTINLAINYAEALMVINRVDSALMYATRANDYAINNGSDAIKARTFFMLGNINMVIRRYSRAQNNYLTAIDGFALSNEVYHLAEVLDSLGAAYAGTGNFEEAYVTRSKAFVLKDSLREVRVLQDADMKLAQAERDQMAKKLSISEAERALAAAQLSQRNTERVAMLAGGLALLLALSFFYYRARLRAALNKKLQRQVDLRTQELRDRGLTLEAQARSLSESNADLERFAYIASHDLKTPLRNITSFLGLIQRRLPPESRALVDEYLEIAIGNARHMNELITDVLEFSRLNADLAETAVPTSVASVFAQTRNTLHAELEQRNARLELVGDVTVVLPKGTLDQLLGNLIANGLKYNQSPRPIVKVVVIDMGERVRISVADNGIGIAPEYHDRVFEVFRRLHTSDEYSGTGVGLAACRKIVLRLGGEIRVESAVGSGSTFIVDLPKQACTIHERPTLTTQHA